MPNTPTISLPHFVAKGRSVARQRGNVGALGARRQKVLSATCSANEQADRTCCRCEWLHRKGAPGCFGSSALAAGDALHATDCGTPARYRASPRRDNTCGSCATALFAARSRCVDRAARGAEDHLAAGLEQLQAHTLRSQHWSTRGQPTRHATCNETWRRGWPWAAARSVEPVWTGVPALLVPCPASSSVLCLAAWRACVHKQVDQCVLALEAGAQRVASDIPMCLACPESCCGAAAWQKAAATLRSKQSAARRGLAAPPNIAHPLQSAPKHKRRRSGVTPCGDARNQCAHVYPAASLVPTYPVCACAHLLERALAAARFHLAGQRQHECAAQMLSARQRSLRSGTQAKASIARAVA